MKVYSLTRKEKDHRGRVSKKSRKKLAKLKAQTRRDCRKAEHKELRDEYGF